jgi:DNA repair protein RecO (recombination protein O)
MARSSSRTDRALILRRFRYGESSLLVHALTPRFGRVAVLAKGAYRLRSGYFGVLDFFDTLELTWRPSRTDLGTLSAARILRRRRAVSTDLARYRAGLSTLELARRGAREGSPESPLFEALENALEGLGTTAADPGLILIAFDLAWLAQAGLAPACNHCAACGRSSQSPKRGPQAFFSHARGGLLCSSCRVPPRGPGERIDALPWKVVEAAHDLSRTPIEHLEQVRRSPQVTQGVAQLVTRFLEYHLERRLKSRRSTLATGTRRKLPHSVNPKG